MAISLTRWLQRVRLAVAPVAYVAIAGVSCLPKSNRRPEADGCRAVQSQGIDILQSRSHFSVRQGKLEEISAKSLMQIPPHVIGLDLALQLSICQIDTRALPAPF